MWIYEKKLQYPVKIKNTNARLAKVIISQYGGAYGKCLGSLTNAPTHKFKRFPSFTAFNYFFKN